MKDTWANWVPKTPLAEWMKERFTERDLWEQEELFALLPETPGLTRNDFFREEMHDNDDWPWTSFKARTHDKGLKLGVRYLRRRASWNPTPQDNAREDPRVSTAKHVLILIDTLLKYAPLLSNHEKHSTIVTGNLIRIRDRVRNELERLQGAA